jgi:hypothetical protein
MRIGVPPRRAPERPPFVSVEARTLLVHRLPQCTKKAPPEGGASTFLPQEEVARKFSSPSRRRKLKNGGLRFD